jgi:hypothetical protein
MSYSGTVLAAYCGLTYNNGTAKLSVIDVTGCTTTGSGSSSVYNVVNTYGTLICLGTDTSLPSEYTLIGRLTKGLPVWRRRTCVPVYSGGRLGFRV